MSSFKAFALNSDVILDFIDYALRACQMKRLIAVGDETEYIVFAVEFDELRRFDVMLAHICVGDFGLQVRHLV